MRIQVGLGLSLAIIVAGATAAVAQGTLRSIEPAPQLSLTVANQSAKVAVITCLKSGARSERIETPVWVQWDNFQTLKFRKGNNTLYQTLATFDKNAEKLNGGHITAQGRTSGSALRIVIAYSTDGGKTWPTREFEAKTSLDCLPAGS